MFTDKMISDIYKIYAHFGKELQEIQTVSECYEYISAVKDSNPNTWWYIRRTQTEIEESIIDEKADCFIMFMQHYINDERVRERVNFKIERTLQRIKDGYYDK